MKLALFWFLFAITVLMLVIAGAGDEPFPVGTVVRGAVLASLAGSFYSLGRTHAR